MKKGKRQKEKLYLHVRFPELHVFFCLFLNSEIHTVPYKLKGNLL